MILQIRAPFKSPKRVRHSHNEDPERLLKSVYGLGPWVLP